MEENAGIPRTRQCKLLGVPRSGSYYKCRARSEPKGLRAAPRELYRLDPCLGLRKLPGMLERDYGIRAGAKLIARVRREMKLCTNYRHPNTSRPAPGKEGRKPYLFKQSPPARVDDAWTSDITYLQIGKRNLYLCCVMDWVSREVPGWSMEWLMDTGLCMAALEMALCSGRKPAVFNTDQGSQYTSREWTEAMERHGITISMDGKGRWADNIVMERFWRTYKYDFFHLCECRTLEEAREQTAAWLDYYNTQRPHESLGYETPSGRSKKEEHPPAAIFSRVSCASSMLAPLRSAPSLRSGCMDYATETREKIG